MNKDTYFVTAMRDGIAQAMREDKTVVLFGEDADKSVMGSTKGLIEEFGKERVINMPLSEATMVGLAVGAAAAGLKPIIDLMVSSFFYITMDQIANQAAKLRYMSGGQVSLPIVYFAATGGAGSAAAQHSENPHPTLAQQAGIKVVIPSNSSDAKNLMLASIRDPNPVVFLQEAVLGGSRGPISEELEEIRLSVGRLVRPGTDLTVFTVGRTVAMAQKAAEVLEKENISIEIIDPRTIYPWDKQIVLSSVEKTGRFLAVDTSRKTCGFGGEVLATVATEAFSCLKVAPQRLCPPDTPMPFAPHLEKFLSVSEEKIVLQVRKMMGRS